MNKQHGYKNTELIQASLKKRYAREKRFQWYGRLAVLTGFVFLFILLFDIVSKGYPAFTQQFIKVTVDFDADRLGVEPGASEEVLYQANYLGVIKNSLREMFPEASGRQEKRQLYRLISIGAEYQLRDYVIENPEVIGSTQDIWLMAHSEAGAYLKGQVTREISQGDRKIKDIQMQWLDSLIQQGRGSRSWRVSRPRFTAPSLLCW
jgi:phosphate transport system permease protein